MKRTAPSATARIFRGQALQGACPATLFGVSRDSRSAGPGEAYIAQVDDPAHTAQALARGAAVVVAARGGLRSPHPRWSFARASCALSELDEQCPPLIAATGTKGKSTITHIVWWLLGAGAARVGTIGWHDGMVERANRQTTPPPDELHAFLAALPDTCPGVALEASSHGCDQFRLAGLRLRALAFTGIGHDHLDYHGTPQAYIAAKLRAVQLLVAGGRLVVNADDAHASVFFHAGRSVGAEVIMLSAIDVQQLAPPIALPGTFNAWNAAAALLMVEPLGVPRWLAEQRLRTLPAVPGRLERLAEAPITYVDYAHTPESIAAVLAAVRAAHPTSPVAIVFGCGGDRDTSKRAPMGLAAATADFVVVTTDNSRSEDPRLIAQHVLAGVGSRTPTVVEPDRARAIRLAREHVGTHGVVVVAGKGHETTQEIQGTITPWDDRMFVRSLSAPSSV